ncbi:hypothetical protein ACN2WE_05305 [Streptomyces sp. cg28]|uniref:hypothetical protein n=1 Tax=Streptomyces sp. cg28 TaxID=3403457 RepID=UPI003B217585
MIPAAQPYRARFKHEKGGRASYTFLTVIAWDDDGHALVVDSKRGLLVRASSYGNFDTLWEGDNPVVGAIPGGGWAAVFKEDDGTLEIDPLVAWHVYPNGTLSPVTMERGGMTEDPTDATNFERLLAPGETPPEGDEDTVDSSHV